MPLPGVVTLGKSGLPVFETMDDPMGFLGSLAGGKQPFRPGAVLGAAGFAELSEVGEVPLHEPLPCSLQDPAWPKQGGGEFRKGRWLLHPD